MLNIVLSSSQQCRCKTPTLIGNLIVKELLNLKSDIKQHSKMCCNVPWETAKMRTIRLKKNFVKYLKTKYPTNKIKPLTQNRISSAENCATSLPPILLTHFPAKQRKIYAVKTFDRFSVWISHSAKFPSSARAGCVETIFHAASCVSIPSALMI